MCSVEKMASSCRCGACSFHWVPLPSDTVGRVVINACVLPLGCLWPYTSLSSPPQLSILLTKIMWISHISFVLSHSALCSTFSSSSSYLLSGSRHIVQGFPPSASFAHPVIVGIYAAGRGRMSGGRGLLRQFCHCIPESILPSLELTSRLSTGRALPISQAVFLVSVIC